MRWWSATKWIIAINIAVFIVDWMARGRLTQWGAFSADAGIYRLQLWRWITYEFLHADVFHLLFNMWALWIFGPTVEQRLKRGSYLAFYLLSGLGGCLGYLLLWRLGLLDTMRNTQLIGASACIFGCLVAAAHLAPNVEIRFIFPPVTLRLKTMAWVCVGLAVLVIAQRAQNSGGEAAHLGGAAVGFVLIRNVEWLGALRLGRPRHRFWRPGDPSSSFFRQNP
jgi:membrane associated rhomboid family serine protease